MTAGTAWLGRWLVASCLLAAPGVARAGAAGAGALGFVPAGSEAATRGAAALERFGLGGRYELTLQVANAFSAPARAAIARVEASLAALPGVKRVAGPAGLLKLAVDRSGRVSSTPLFPSARAEGARLLQSRLNERQDAVGWFVSSDGTAIRLLIDADDIAALRAPIRGAVESAGLPLLDGEIPLRALWPDPQRDPLPFGRRRPLQLALLAMLVPLLAAAFFSGMTFSRAILCALSAGAAAAAPGLMAPVPTFQTYAGIVATAAAALSFSLWMLGRVSSRLRGRPSSTPTAEVALAPPAVLVASLALLAGAAVLSPRLRLETELGHESPFVFVDVRADLTEPIVLRELRRLTDLLNSRPGIDEAWSVADLFNAVSRPHRGFGGIPDDPQTTRAILIKAAGDPAVQLALSPDLQEALITVRLDEGSGFDRTRVIDGIKRVIGRNLRPALARVDVNDETLARATRAFGRGALAEDARLRLARLCQREGRNLAPDDERAIDQSLRRVVLAPRLEPARFRAEVSGEVMGFLEEISLAEAHVSLPHPAQRQRLIDALLAIPGEPGPAQVSRALAELWGARTPGRLLEPRAAELARRLVTVRRRAIANAYSRTILADANLATEGGLSEKVRDVTLEAMGPIVGIPTPKSAPNAFVIDAAVVGAGPADRALALAWGSRIPLGVAGAAVLAALLLMAAGGFRALSYWPAALAPAAVVLLVPAVAGLPMGSLLVALFSGALGGGIAFAVAFCPGRRAR